MRSGMRALLLAGCGLLFVGLAECRLDARQMAVIVNQGNTAQDLTTAELSRIFKCDTRSWPGGNAVTVVVRDPSTPEMELLLSRIYKTTPEQLRNFIATHKNSMVMVDSDEAMLSAVHTMPGAIGLVDVFLINKEVKVLKVDGKLPVEYGYILRGH